MNGTIKATNNKKKKRFNIIDLLVLLLVLSIIAGGVYYFSSPELTGNEYVDVQYTILIKSIKASHRGKIAIGDTVIETRELCEIGNVTGVTESTATTTTVDLETGDVLQSTIPGYVSIKVTVSARAKKENSFYSINGVPIRVGEAVYFRVPDLCAAGYCESFKIIEEDN